MGEITPVALRKESVDRNASARLILTSALWSLSARRAWIETVYIRSVIYSNWSLSARRAWIETTSDI